MTIQGGSAPAGLPEADPRRDSLVIAHVVELLGGGVASEHPDCPGAVFRLSPGYDIGAPQPSADVVAKLLQGGSRPHGRWADNRTVKLPVLIYAPDRATLVAARELLARLLNADQFELRWTRGLPAFHPDPDDHPGDPQDPAASAPPLAGAGPMILDCFRAGPAAPTYSVLAEQQNYANIEVTFQALPYGRSADRETVWFRSPINAGEPPPVYQDWQILDNFSAISSEAQPGRWGRSDSNNGAWRYSAHWNPLSPKADPKVDYPVYRRTLPAAYDMTGRGQINVWVGLGNSNGQWRSGNLTFRMTLWDIGENWMQFGGTFKLAASDNWNKPRFDRISLVLPRGTGFNMAALHRYQLEVTNFTSAARMGDIYLNCMGVAPTAVAWTPASRRDQVYTVVGQGSARTPVSLRFQPPAIDGNGNPLNYRQTFLRDQGNTTGTWLPPATLRTAPDGTPDAVRARVWAGAGAGGSINNSTGLAGGGAAGNCSGDDHYKVTRNQPVDWHIGDGQAGNAAANPRPNPGQDSYFGPGAAGTQRIVSRGGLSAERNSWRGASPGPAPAPLGPDNWVPPVHYFGGWGAYSRPAGQPGQGAGGGGGGAGSSGPGKEPAGQPGGDGGPGGGHGGGGQSPFARGPGSPGGGPSGGGGGAGVPAGANQTQNGSKGAPGKLLVEWLEDLTPMRTLVCHMPGPDAPTLFVPCIPVNNAAVSNPPDSAHSYVVASPQEGQPVRYSGTYTAVLAVRTWNNPTAARNVWVDMQLYDHWPGGQVIGSAQPGGVGVRQGYIPSAEPGGAPLLLTLGAVTLPLTDVPEDNRDATYVVTVHSSDTADRFLDLLLLDVTGQTIAITCPATPSPPGFTDFFFDEPSTTALVGPILGGNGGRTEARSVTNYLTACSGVPFMLEPGPNLIMAYSLSGGPSLGMEYWPRWWFDRADDLVSEHAPDPGGFPFYGPAGTSPILGPEQTLSLAQARRAQRGR